MAMINIDPGLVPHLPESNHPTRLIPKENIQIIAGYPRRSTWDRYYPDSIFGPVPLPKAGGWPRWYYYDPDPEFSPWSGGLPNKFPKFGPVPMPRWPRKPRDWYYYDQQPDNLLMRYDPFNPTRNVQLMANKDNAGANIDTGYRYDPKTGTLIGGVREDKHLKPPPSQPPVMPQEPQEPKKGITKEEVKSAINNILNITSTAAKTYNELSRQGEETPTYTPAPNINTNIQIGGDLPLDVPPAAFDKLPYFDSGLDNTRRKPIVTKPPYWMQPFTTSLNPNTAIFNNLYDPDYSIHYDGMYNLMDAGVNSIASIPEIIKNIPQGLMDYGDYWGRNAQTYGETFRQKPFNTLANIGPAYLYGVGRGINDILQSSIDIPYGVASTYTGQTFAPYQLPNIRNMTDRYGQRFEKKNPNLDYVKDLGSLASDLALTLGAMGAGGSAIAPSISKFNKYMPPNRSRFGRIGIGIPSKLYNSTKNLSKAEIRAIIDDTIEKINKSKDLLSEELEMAKRFVRHCPDEEKVVVGIEGVVKSFKHLRELQKKGINFTFHGQFNLIKRINKNEIKDPNLIAKTVKNGDKYREKTNDGFKIVKTKIIDKERYVVIQDENTKKIITFFKADKLNLLNKNLDTKKWIK